MTVSNVSRNGPIDTNNTGDAAGKKSQVNSTERTSQARTQVTPGEGESLTLLMQEIEALNLKSAEADRGATYSEMQDVQSASKQALSDAQQAASEQYVSQIVEGSTSIASGLIGGVADAGAIGGFGVGSNAAATFSSTVNGGTSAMSGIGNVVGGHFSAQASLDTAKSQAISSSSQPLQQMMSTAQQASDSAVQSAQQVAQGFAQAEAGAQESIARNA